MGLVTLPFGAVMIAVALCYLGGRLSVVSFGVFGTVVGATVIVASTVYLAVTRHNDLHYFNTPVDGIVQHLRAGPWITLSAGFALVVVGVLALTTSRARRPSTPIHSFGSAR